MRGGKASVVEELGGNLSQATGGSQQCWWKSRKSCRPNGGPSPIPSHEEQSITRLWHHAGKAMKAANAIKHVGKARKVASAIKHAARFWNLDAGHRYGLDVHFGGETLWQASHTIHRSKHVFFP